MRCAPAFVTPKNGYGLWVTGYRLSGQKSKVERQKTSFYFERSGPSTLRRKAPVYKENPAQICMGGIFFAQIFVVISDAALTTSIKSSLSL